MALYLKQDFNPTILTKKWVAMKFRPNMLLYNREHIISILESGLLFREDSIEVEQETAAGDLSGGGPWLTGGEKLAAAAAVTACVLVYPPKSLHRSTLFHLAAYLSLPVAVRLVHRLACKGTLPALLSVMRDYLTLARRALACLRECTALKGQLGSIASAIESTHAMLCRQQSEMAITMSRMSSALLGNAPWLRSDVAWDVLPREDTDNLMKIHHAFLVVQSTLLKHIAMAHVMPTLHANRLYKNHNERIYWIHTVLIQNLTEEFIQNLEALQRMYRLLKNYGNADHNVAKRSGTVLRNNWLYSDVHNDVARANLELKLALNKCNNLDMFLDSCASEKQQLDLEVLNKDIDNLIGNITKCLATAQSSQIRLRKLMGKFKKQEVEVDNKTEVIENEKTILSIDNREPETKDEVYYFVKTDDDDTSNQGVGDIITAPGKKEKEATKVVLNELRRKLVIREDLMRERERQALAKTMPELKDHIPEFPRQIKIEEVLERKGYMSKLKSDTPKKRIFREKKIQRRRCSYSNLKTCYRLIKKFYDSEDDIKPPLYEANFILSVKSKLLSFIKSKERIFYVLEWHKNIENTLNEEREESFDISDVSEGLSDIEVGAVNKTVNEAVNFNNKFKYNRENGDAFNYKFTKKDLELTPSSEEDSDSEMHREFKMSVLKDVRRYRAARKKNFPGKQGLPGRSQEQDESLKPTQYSLGAGLAMASVLQGKSKPIPAFVQEEVFIGDGEVSEDSGNDDV